MMIALGVLVLSSALLQTVAVTPSTPAPKPCPAYTQNVWDARFSPNQRWSYHAREVDKGSTVIITKIDDVPGIGPVIHFRVDHVSYSYDTMTGDKTIHHNAGLAPLYLYLAMRRDSFDASVEQMLGISVLSEPADAYSRWQGDCDGLTYAATIADTIKTLQVKYWAEFCSNNAYSHECPITARKKYVPATRAAPLTPATAPPAPTPNTAPVPSTTDAAQPNTLVK